VLASSAASPISRSVGAYPQRSAKSLMKCRILCCRQVSSWSGSGSGQSGSSIPPFPVLLVIGFPRFCDCTMPHATGSTIDFKYAFE
jgi:hypothetical protein